MNVFVHVQNQNYVWELPVIAAVRTVCRRDVFCFLSAVATVSIAVITRNGTERGPVKTTPCPKGNQCPLTFHTFRC